MSRLTSIVFTAVVVAELAIFDADLLALHPIVSQGDEPHAVVYVTFDGTAATAYVRSERSAKATSIASGHIDHVMREAADHAGWLSTYSGSTAS